VTTRSLVEAEQFGAHESVPVEILLIAVLRESAGVAARAFDSLGVDRAKLRRDLAAVVPPPRVLTLQETMTRDVPSDAEGGLSRFPYHGTIHDLFAALRDHDGRIAKVLARHRITAYQIRRAARRLADDNGISEGGTYSPATERTIGESIALFQSDDLQFRIEAGLSIMSWASTLAESDTATLAEYASRVVPLMHAALRDPSEDIRYVGANVLNNFGEHAKEALPVARELVGKGGLVAIEAARVVWNVTADAEAVFPAILAAMNGEHPTARGSALVLLVKVAKATKSVPPELLSILIGKLKSPDVADSLLVCQILAKLNSTASAAVPALLELLAELDRLPAEKEANTHFGFSAEHRLALAVGALFRIHPDRDAALSAVRGFLGRKKPELARGVLVGWTIAGRSAAIALPQVEWLIAHPDPGIRVLAMVAHRRLTSENTHEAALLKSLPTVTVESQVIIAGLLKENDEPELAARVLAQFDTPPQQPTPPQAPAAKPQTPTDPLTDELLLWNEALQFDPSDSQALLLRAQVHLRAKEYDSAIADCRQAVALDPADAFARKWFAESLNFRGISFKRQRDFERALADYSEAIDLNPTNAGIIGNRAMAYFGQGNEEKGFADLEAAIVAEPDREVGWNNLAWHLATTPDERFRDPARALPLATRSCEATAYADPGRLSTLAAAYAAKGEFGEAVRWVEQALERVPAHDTQSREIHEKHRQLYLSGKPVIGND